MRIPRAAGLALGALLLTQTGAAGAAEVSGVVVEDVTKGSAAEKAGLQPGDILVSWTRPGAPGGRLASAFDFTDLEIEQAPRGQVTLSVERKAGAVSATLPPGAWGLRVRPRMSETSLAAYAEGKRLLEAKDTAGAAARWQEEALRAKGERQWTLAAWLLLEVDDASASGARWDEAHAAYRAALEAARETGSPVAVAQAWEAQGQAFLRRNELKEAEAAFRAALLALEQQTRESLRIAADRRSLGIALERQGKLEDAEGELRRSLATLEQLTPEAPEVGAALRHLGRVVGNRGDLPAEEKLLVRAIALLERVAPESFLLADAVNNLAVNHARRGQLEAAEPLFRRSLELHEKLDPGTLPYARAVFNVGNMANVRGDLVAAEGFYQATLAVREKLAPGSLELAEILNNLGTVAANRGNLAAAEEFFRRALGIWEQRAPESHMVADLLHNIGTLSLDRGALDAAEEPLRRALALKEKLAPGSLEVATTLSNLGNLMREPGQIADAEDMQRKAMAIREAQAPGSGEHATSLGNLGDLAKLRGDSATAESFYRRAVEIERSYAPGGLLLAGSLQNLGELALERGALDEAELQLKAAAAIRAKLAPGSAKEATSLHALGLLSRKRKDMPGAAEYFRRAIEALESQMGKLGGSESVRSGFRAQHRDIYNDYMDLLLELKRPEDAFGVLERSRARSLLAMLAERTLDLSTDVPADLDRERRLNDAAFQKTQDALDELSPEKSPEEFERLSARLRQLREEHDEIAARIRQASPRFASLRYPEPFDLLSAQKVLDPGTVALSYAVGKDKSRLFVLQPKGGGGTGLRVLDLPIGEAALREQVAAFRNLLNRSAGTPPASLAEAGRRLYEALVAPAESAVAKADRLLISPDGPLHTLPFGALTGPRGYLAEWKSFNVVVSATLFGELKKARRPAEAGKGAGKAEPVLAAFGDPAYASLEPLPASRAEVEAIGGLWPAQLYLGPDATEDHARTLGPDVRYVHFACHGLIDERFPLSSALALSDGLLEAWEILEKVRLDADLVTLSACETALGKEIGRGRPRGPHPRLPVRGGALHPGLPLDGLRRLDRRADEALLRPPQGGPAEGRRPEERPVRDDPRRRPVLDPLPLGRLRARRRLDVTRPVDRHETIDHETQLPAHRAGAPYRNLRRAALRAGRGARRRPAEASPRRRCFRRRRISAVEIPWPGLHRWRAREVGIPDPREVGRGDPRACLHPADAQPLPVECLDDLCRQDGLQLPDVRVRDPQVAEDVAATPHHVQLLPHRAVPTATCGFRGPGPPLRGPDGQHVALAHGPHIRRLQGDQRLGLAGRPNELHLDSVRAVELHDRADVSTRSPCSGRSASRPRYPTEPASWPPRANGDEPDVCLPSLRNPDGQDAGSPRGPLT